MELDLFLRTFQSRKSSLAWLLGAGASAAGGIATAGDMIWDFKRLLYCSRELKPIEACEDLGDPALRARLSHYFEHAGGYPAPGDDEEYAAFFELAYPAEADRRQYLEGAVARGTPSYGHLALAAMMRADATRVMWTTNFDRLIEDAAARVFGTTARLQVASPDSGAIALQALNENRWPFFGKLHGDFQSRRLRNTSEELRTQDAKLRNALLESCRRFGLVVAGYSGRDKSVMQVLREAAGNPGGFPGGLFWLVRGAASPAIESLIALASSVGIEAQIVSIVTFDELMGDLVRMLPDLPDEMKEMLRANAARVSDAPIPGVNGGLPVVRLNALRVRPAPASCRLVDCKIGGTAEVRAAVARSGAKLVVARRNVGVLAFGRDADVRAAFDAYAVLRFDLHAIQPARLRFDSAELGLLYEALGLALSRERPLVVGRRGRLLVARVDATRLNEPVLRALSKQTKGLTGQIDGTGATWFEGIRLRLEYRLESLWLIFEPTVWTERDEARPDNFAEQIGAFVASRIASRYNSVVNEIFAAWANVLTLGAEVAELRAFGIADGVDASFTLHRTTAFSHRRIRSDGQ